MHDDVSYALRVAESAGEIVDVKLIEIIATDLRLGVWGAVRVYEGLDLSSTEPSNYFIVYAYGCVRMRSARRALPHGVRGR